MWYVTVRSQDVARVCHCRGSGVTEEVNELVQVRDGVGWSSGSVKDAEWEGGTCQRDILEIEAVRFLSRSVAWPRGVFRMNLEVPGWHWGGWNPGQSDEERGGLGERRSTWTRCLHILTSA